jgi:hypothetical protein
LQKAREPAVFNQHHQLWAQMMFAEAFKGEGMDSAGQSLSDRMGYEQNEFYLSKLHIQHV